MAHYLTRQRKLLLEYLSLHPDEALSARMIAADLVDRGISASAVYRNLAALEEEHQLRKIGVNDAGEVIYQYIGAQHCRESLHFSCIKCKKTIHLQPETAQQVIDLVAGRDRCLIIREQTVLYGLCENCQ